MRFRYVIAPLLLSGIALAQAQQYPSRSVRVVASVPAAGPGDHVGQAIAQKLSEVLGQQFIIDNRAGAAGIIAADAVSKAPPDGYTLLWTSSETFPLACLYKKLPFERNDLIPVARVGTSQFALVGHGSLPAKTVTELVSLARSRPRNLNYASTGNGTQSHLGFEWFKLAAGIDITHVPHKGSAEAVVALMGGQVELAMLSLAAATPNVRSGKIRALAVTGAKRTNLLPDTPTLREAGVQIEIVGWLGAFAPAKTPKAIVDRLDSEIAKMLKDSRVAERLRASGYDSDYLGSADFGAFLAKDAAHWCDVITKIGFRID